MHHEVIKKIRRLRISKGLSTQQMSEKLNIDVSAYTRLESGKTSTWAKYLPELLLIFESDPVSFFGDLAPTSKPISPINQNANKILVEDSTAENKEKDKKIEFLYQERLKDKDMIIAQLEKIIEKLTS